MITELSTLQDVANVLNGREYGLEITREEEEILKKLGFVVVFGYSDDNAELRGAVHDEIYDPSGNIIFYVDLISKTQAQVVNSGFNEIEAIFAPEDEPGNPTWIYQTDIPHETFWIVEDGEKYCRGIVFDIKSLKG